MTVDIGQPRVPARRTLDGTRIDDQRRSPRTAVALPCTLRRAHGSPVAAHARDLGLGGMCVSTSRPLAVDERVGFELALDDEQRVAGQAHVLRKQGFGFYALRFDALADEAPAWLRDLLAAGASMPSIGIDSPTDE